MNRIMNRNRMASAILCAVAALCFGSVALYGRNSVTEQGGLPRGNSARIHSIITNPGEDASTAMNISFACDTLLTGAKMVEYTKASDRSWRKAVCCRPSMERICTVYDSVYSKSPEGEDIFEYPHFIKCSAFLTGLRPSTDYKYRILSSDGDTSAVHTFKTAGKQSWSACIISDFHSYTPIPNRLVSAMGVLSQVESYGKGKLDFVLHIGDVCAWGGSYSFWRRLYEEPCFHKYMWAGLNGNHDNMSRKYLQMTSDFFRYANANPLNGYEGQEGVCYWFMYGDALFIMLNNEEMRTDDGLRAAREWVRKVLSDHKDAKYKIVCEHYQWFSGLDGHSSQYHRWSDIFDEYGVNLAIAGNSHIYLRTCPIYAGKSADGRRGTVCLNTASSDNERGVVLKGPLTDNTDLIQYRWSEGEKTVSAIRMDVNRRGMWFTLLDRDGNVVDRFEVPAE